MHGARAISRNANLIRAICLAGILGLIALAGCSDDNNPANPGGAGGTTSTFSGIFSGGTASGRLNVTVNTTSLAGRGIIKRAGRGLVTATGTVDLGASTITLIGSYDSSSDKFVLAGAGYDFEGQYEANTYGRANINGFWEGPGGEGGSFVCYLGNVSNVTVYCGRYHSNATDSDSTGNWTFGVLDTLLAGYAFGDSANYPNGIAFAGKVSASGNPRTITINYAPGNYTLSALGTIDTTGVDLVNGTFTITATVGPGGMTGTYTGSLCP